MWIIFALLSPAVYTITNYVDKFLLSKRVKDYSALPIYTASVSFIFGFIWWTIAGFPLLPTRDAVIVITTGIITIFSIVVYFKALSSEETSTVILLFQLSPLFTLILSSLFLKESITTKQFYGFGLILSATLLLALPHKDHQTWKVPNGFWLVVVYDILFALIGVLLKFATYESTFTQIIAYESIGMGIGGVLIFFLFPNIRIAFLKSRNLLFKKALPVIILNEIIFIIAKSLGYYAFIIGPVTLVSVLSNVQVFFGIVFAWIITRFFPKILKEDISHNTFMIKNIAASLLFIGLYLMI